MPRLQKLKEIIKNHKNEEELVSASYNGNIIKVKELLKKSVDPNCNISFFRATPLIEASRAANLKIIILLLKAGADTSLQDTSKNTALKYALQYFLSTKRYKKECRNVIYLLHKVIILVPMLSKRFRKINHDIVRESINYLR
jgi:hypothetical protein